MSISRGLSFMSDSPEKRALIPDALLRELAAVMGSGVGCLA